MIENTAKCEPIQYTSCDLKLIYYKSIYRRFENWIPRIRSSSEYINYILACKLWVDIRNQIRNIINVLLSINSFLRKHRL